MQSRRRPWLKILIVGILLLLSAQLAGLNSLEYQIARRSNQIELRLFDQFVVLNDPAVDATLLIDFYPQRRFSSGQFLLAGGVNWWTGIKLWEALAFWRKAQPSPSILLKPQQSVGLVHLNPFRAGIRLASADVADVRLEINVPDASLEVWKGPDLIKNTSIKLPWWRLTLAPLLSLMSLAGALVIGSQLIVGRKSEANYA